MSGELKGVGIDALSFRRPRSWTTLALSVALPFFICGFQLINRGVSRTTATLLGFVLVAVAGLDVFVLQSLAVVDKESASLADDAVCLSENGFSDGGPRRLEVTRD